MNRFSPRIEVEAHVQGCLWQVAGVAFAAGLIGILALAACVAG